MKQSRNLRILEAILAVLVLIYAGVSLYQRSSAEKEAEDEIRLVDIDNVTSFGYEEGDASMSYTKTEGVWTYDEDPEIPMNQSVIENAEETLQNLCAVRELEDPDALEDYGLSEPAYHMWLDGGGKEATIYVGDATGENYYATVDDTGTVYTISSDTLSYLPFEMDAVVQTDEVPTISSGNLVQVSVTEDGETKNYTSQEDLDELAGGYGALTLDDVENYHVSSEDLSTYGLDSKNRITATATYTDSDTEEEETFTVYIGKEDAEKENRYVTVKDSHIVYLIANSVAENMITGSDS